MIRRCPSCHAERPANETLCQTVIDGSACGWDLSLVHLTDPGAPLPGSGQPPAQPPANRACPQGHAIDEGDLLCLICGAELSGDEDPAGPEPASQLTDTIIAGWRLFSPLSAPGRVRQRFVAERLSDGHRAVLTLYNTGAEPDPNVYAVLQRLDTDHVPAIIETGRWSQQAYEVAEDLAGGTLADLGPVLRDMSTIRRITNEVGRALQAFAEAGLRHRDLRPDNVRVRTHQPLDLVITGFGSACLSELDLDIVSPLETSRYMAPEAIMGGVSAASDWWSLGMMLLELVTGGACFDGISEPLFLIHVLTNGAPIPPGLDPQLDTLLHGLLERDRSRRWQMDQVQDWLAGKVEPVVNRGDQPTESASGPSIALGNRPFTDPLSLALAASRAQNWDEAVSLLSRGALATWSEQIGLDARISAHLRHIAQQHDIAEELRLAVALKLLNPALPLIHRERIINPGWLLDNPQEAYDLITGPVPALLDRFGCESEGWLLRLGKRAQAVRARATVLDIALDEETLRINLLSTSRARLSAIWEERRRLLPDTAHPGLAAICDRPQTTDEDLIVLASASPSQFRPRDVVLAEAQSLAQEAGIALGTADEIETLLVLPRRNLYLQLDQRIEAFAHCGNDRLDAWADQFRLERRLPLARVLVLLAVPADQWRKPPHQDYVSELLTFFEKRIAGAILRGPLVRMNIGKTTARVDLAELEHESNSAVSLLEHLLHRTDRAITLPPDLFSKPVSPEARLRKLLMHTLTYQRDTGINGLYLGFPFLVHRDPSGQKRPYLAPILLWPVKMVAAVGGQGHFTIGFDRDREEVRLNPAFEGMLGLDVAARWRQVADDLLNRTTLRASDVIDGFAAFARPQGTALRSLPERLAGGSGDDEILCTAVLFHVEFMGQAMLEDLRQLKALPPQGSALEAILRIGDKQETQEPAASEIRAAQHLVAASDPSQEEALDRAWQEPGLLIQGPPGTGKSQTIVNLVSDAVGRGKSLLVVCQKLPALEVVAKRLVAEGLGERIMMITDVHKDRQPVIRTVREQLEGLWAQDGMAHQADRFRREALAEQIASLEADIDRHHEALYHLDPLSGLPYRGILGELLALENEAGALPDLPALRRLLANLPMATVNEIQSICASLAHDWLSAQFEGSPLSIVREFQSDTATVADFSGRFEAFVEAETARDEALAATLPGCEVDDPGPLKTWLTSHAGYLQKLPESVYPLLGTWLPIFREGRAGSQYVNVIGQLVALQNSGLPSGGDLPELKVLLGNLGPQRLTGLPEACGVLAPYWLAAPAGATPLDVVTTFEPSNDAIRAYTDLLTAFVSTESTRLATTAAHGGTTETTAPKALSTWLEAHGARLMTLGAATCERLAKWFPQFHRSQTGNEQLQSIDQVVTKLAALDDHPYNDSLVEAVMALPPPDLLMMLEAAQRATAPADGVLSRLQPSRIFARRRLRLFLRKHGVPGDQAAMVEFLNIATTEHQLRPCRKKLATVASTLGRQSRQDAADWLPLVKAQAGVLLSELREIAELVTILGACPCHEEAAIAGSQASQATVADLIVRLKGAAAKGHAREASQMVLQRLQSHMAAEWIARCEAMIAANCSTDDLTQPILANLDHLPTLQAYRLAAARAGTKVVEALEHLAAFRPRLSGMAVEGVGPFVGLIVRWNIVQVRRECLEADDPLLANLAAKQGTSLPKVHRTLAVIEDVAKRLSECPLASEVELAARSGSKAALDQAISRFHGAIMRREAQQRSIAALVALGEAFDETWLAACHSSLTENKSNQDRIAPVLSAIPTLAAYQKFRIRAKELTPHVMTTFAGLSNCRSWLTSIAAIDLGQFVHRIIRREACLGCKSRIEASEPLLLSNREEIAFKVGQLAKSDAEMRQLNRTHLAHHIDRGRLATNKRWEDITRLRGERTKRLREFFTIGMDLGLLNVRPVWLMSPDVASQLLPRVRGLFDMVVYDEASQMPVEYALPTLYRGKIAVVSGDDKQMPPTSFFASKVESDEAEVFDGEEPDEDAGDAEREAFEETWNRREIKDCPDLLHLAREALPHRTLQIHYRSAYRELIAFSNAAYYGNELSVPVRHPEDEVRRACPIEVQAVDGLYGDQVNQTEAERVVEVLAGIWQVPTHQRPSVGVVTFNRKQADLIETMLERRAETDPDFRLAYSEELARSDDGEDMGVFVKNVENVQGDERDIIVFSTTFGRNALGVFRRNFGVLGQKGGERRLNVAVTRARRKIIMVTSMPVADVSDFLSARRAPVGPRDYLQAYLGYASMISQGDLANADRLCDRLSPSRGGNLTEAGSLDGLAWSVAAYLRANGYEPIPVGRDPALGLDFAIVHPQTGLFGIGIECEAPRHRLLARARAREIWRPNLLRRAYQVVHRVSAHAWYHSPEAEQERLRSAIDNALKPLSSETE